MTALSYPSQAEKDADKALLERCREALDITRSIMRLDDCGLWNLAGKRGRITTWGDGKGYLLSLYERSARAWGYAKKRLDAATLPCAWSNLPADYVWPRIAVTQDAEREGVFRFELPVTSEQAAEIRDLAGLRRVASEEYLAFNAERARRRGWGRKNMTESVGGYQGAREA
jgi:hypothetical protein